MSFFDLLHQDKNSRARTGIIHTDHGDIETPIFMPVGTQATVKTLDQKDLNTIGAQVILGNTYHLHLRPGENVIAEFGGLHKFMRWDKPILTDSGGFQVFSLGLQKDVRNAKTTTHSTQLRVALSKVEKAKMRNNNETIESASGGNNTSQARLVSIDEDGVTFTSHIDGSTHRFTPESAIETQHKIGADIIMAFDECTPDDVPYAYVKEAMERTHRWAERSLVEHRRLQNPRLGGVGVGSSTLANPSLPSPRRDYRQFLFGIIQGANYQDLREESAKFISSLDFDGIAIGGESIGYNMEATAQILDWVYPLIPANKPHYAMGIGLNPTDLLVAVEHGVDMFDCVAPTRLARHGMLFIFDKEKNHRLNIKNAQFAKDTNPIDTTCACSTCQNYSRAYLHHLFDADEMTGMRLASIHNLHFLLQLMRETREAIKNNTFLELKNKWI